MSLSNYCDIDALFDALLKAVRTDNLSTLLHAVQLSQNPNSIFSCFMGQLKPDRCYLLMSSFLNPVYSVQTFCENQGPAVQNPYSISMLLLTCSAFQQIKFFMLLYMAFDRLAICSVIWL